jgi:hypothetical protein
VAQCQWSESLTTVTARPGGHRDGGPGARIRVPNPERPRPLASPGIIMMIGLSSIGRRAACGLQPLKRYGQRTVLAIRPSRPRREVDSDIYHGKWQRPNLC